MKDKKRLERDIKASKTIIANLNKNIKLEWACLADHQIDLIEAEKELAEVEEPKLRHGEKVTRKSTGQLRLVLYGEDGKLGLWDSKGALQYRNIDSESNRYLSTGESIFDDLKALSEPLTEFEVKAGETYSDNRHILKIEITETGNIAIIQDCSKLWYEIENFESMCKQGLRLVATAKLKAGEKK